MPRYKVPGRCVSAVAFACSVGCQGEIGALDATEPTGAPGVVPGGGGRGGGLAGSGSMSAAAGSGSSGEGSSGESGGGCEGTDVVESARIVRLSYQQIATSIGSLLGNEARDLVTESHVLGDAQSRTFPPLLLEGTVITDSVWQKLDAVAQTAANYAFENFGVLTGCGSSDETCARMYISKFAERAYRRPLEASETASLDQVYSAVRQDGAEVAEAFQYSVYAVLSAPQFLYRREFGDSNAAAGDARLAPYELASQLSYFLSDGPPDDSLLGAASQGELVTEEQVRAQVDRLLETPDVRRNLEAAMVSYFEFTRVQSTTVDPGKVPEYTIGLQSSVFREAELFVGDSIWNGGLTDLVTSQRSFVNDTVAELYGIPFPPAGASLDADGFALVDLPADRAGILTQPGFLITRARPEGETSVVGRGLLVNGSMLCVPSPPFPEALQEEIDKVSAMLVDSTEREKANYRGTTAPCMNCHSNFDAYGLVLENYDVLGRYRSSDSKGRTIDAATTLPDTIGGGTVQSAAELGSSIAESGIFESCLALNFAQYALSDGVVDLDSCALSSIMTNYFAGTSRDFRSLIREIAVSRTLAFRSKGGSR